MDLYENIVKNNQSLFLLAGPCVIEDTKMPYQIAEQLVDITSRLGIKLIFKASYRKANRSKIDSFQGIGDKKALEILDDIRKKFNVNVVTDVHTEAEAEMAAKYVDVLQIPAFLCRQTDLLLACGRTGKIVNIKKGQFLSGESMRYAVEKVKQTGNHRIMLTDRGTFFGYQDLVVDMRSIVQMKENHVPVIMDITHSLQKPNQIEGVSGGDPMMIETIARGAVAVGADGIFIETHPNPEKALSDGKNMLQLDKVEPLLKKLIKLKQTINDL